jgi:hypothetical protein
LRRRIRFLRHFQRIFPRFFHARDERFIRLTPRVFAVFLSSFSSQSSAFDGSAATQKPFIPGRG